MNTTESELPVDSVGAFVVGPELLAKGADGGPLAGTIFAAKDLFDVAGYVTGVGNPDWARLHEPATKNADAVQRLLDAGADLIGKTITDEFAYSLSGTNVHYGSPINSAAPDRVSGGSSSGSAAAVAAGLVPFALASDTGGSTRVPASYCGLFGLRPTHGRIPMVGVHPLAASLDTVGILARTGDWLAKSMTVLLQSDATVVSRPLIILDDVVVLADEQVADQVNRAAKMLADHLGVVLRHESFGALLNETDSTFRVVQGSESWATHGNWITENQPKMGSGIVARFEAASRWSTDDIAAANERRAEVRVRLEQLTEDGIVIVPSVATVAPELNQEEEAKAAMRARALQITSIASLAGAPGLSLPLAHVDGLPVGLGLVESPGGDEELLGIARSADVLIDSTV